MRNQTLDRLTLCAIAAEKEGLSYGKYMVKYDYSPPCLGYPQKEPSLSPPPPAALERAQVLACPECGKQFYALRKRTYCSYDCQYRHNKKAMTQRYAQSHQREPRRCEVCGIEIPHPTSVKQVCCSAECAAERHRERARIRSEERRKRLKGENL